VNPPALPPPPRAFTVARLLWATARRRAVARARRQREIMGRRPKPDEGQSLSGLMRLLVVLVVCGMHALLGWFAVKVVRPPPGPLLDREGRLVVASGDWKTVEFAATTQKKVEQEQAALERLPRTDAEARRRADLQLRVSTSQRDRALRHLETVVLQGRKERVDVARQFRERGIAGFVSRDDSLAARLGHSHTQPVAIVPVLTLIFAGWWLMLVCQGEGLELDVQRRRHPMWEWLASHPIHPAHAFYAELLSPLMSNPVYFSAPVFLWVIFSQLLGVGSGLFVALLAGLPLAVVASATNKAVETAALLRLGVRTRGALLGVLSWFGYVTMVFSFLSVQFDGFAQPLLRAGAWLAPWWPAWPLRALTIGWGETASSLQVVASWWLLVAALAAAVAWGLQRATAQGLQAPSEGGRPVRAALLGTGGRLGAEPLRRKELLWLLRDRGAVVQVILIPLTIAAVQAFNFRGLFHLATLSWSSLCGLGIVCGTYFLLVLGPRSLASEGPALWLALTWPRGLEDLLRAKARLWSRVASTAVGFVLAVTCLLFPADWWKILLVGGAWLVFGDMLALKAVSLVNAPSSSGETEPPNRARHWIAMTGTLAFGTGVMTGNWHVAVIGVVLSSLVAVAMWQGLRARLPFLFDPWSEQPVPAPTLLHVAVGVALLGECIGLFIAIASIAGGPGSVWFARAIGYGLAGAIGCVVMQNFLSDRGVHLRDIIRWHGAPPRWGLGRSTVLAAAIGVGLALGATLCLAILHTWPAAREMLEQAEKHAAAHPGARGWLFLVAVVFAPVAEEYFFRGLLFRVLDREIGGGRALLLSAAVFAIIHPPLSWLPVAAAGAIMAWLFRQTRHLLPCIACHAAYNATLVVLPLIV
jgi:membrane protease YdiL (CAAX protease family)